MREIILRVIENRRASVAFVFFCALALYVTTMAPTVLWGDEAAFQRACAVPDLTFSVTSHPLWLLIVRIFSFLPFGDAAWRANCMSAFFGALTVTVFFVLGERTGSSAAARWMATAVLGISHALWINSVRAEVYTLNSFCFLLVWLLVQLWHDEGRWHWILLAAGVWLVSLVNHLLMLVAVPGYLLLAGSRFMQPRRRVLALVTLSLSVLLLIGIVVMVGPVRTMMAEAWSATWPPRIKWRIVILGVGLLCYNFILSLPLICVGLKKIWGEQPLYAGVILTHTACFMGLTLSSHYAEDCVFYLPAYIALALALPIGIDLMRKRWVRLSTVTIVALLVLLPVVVYRAIPEVLNRTSIKLLPLRDLPGRDAEMYYLWPPKMGYAGARDFGESVLHSLPPNALILADGTPGKTLWYLQYAEDLRKDVVVAIADPDIGNDASYTVVRKPYQGTYLWRIEGAQAKFLLDQVHEHVLFLADIHQYYDMTNIKKHFMVEPFGLIYQLKPILSLTSD